MVAKPKRRVKPTAAKAKAAAKVTEQDTPMKENKRCSKPPPVDPEATPEVPPSEPAKRVRGKSSETGEALVKALQEVGVVYIVLLCVYLSFQSWTSLLWFLHQPIEKTYVCLGGKCEAAEANGGYATSVGPEDSSIDTCCHTKADSSASIPSLSSQEESAAETRQRRTCGTGGG